MSESHAAPVPPVPVLSGGELPPDEPLEIVFADQAIRAQSPAPARPEPAQGGPAGDPLRDAASEPCTRLCADDSRGQTADG